MDNLNNPQPRGRKRKHAPTEFCNTSPWLLGRDALRQYLGNICNKTLENVFLKQGLYPRAAIGQLYFYHKDDVDNFLITHNQWQDVPTNTFNS